MSEFHVTIESGSSKRLPVGNKWSEKDIIVTATGGAENLDDVLTEQQTLIEELKEVLRGKAEGSGGDGFVECKTLNAAKTNTVADIADLKIRYPNAAGLGIQTFASCVSLVAIDLPNVTSVPYRGFIGCTSLTDVNAPNVTSIGEEAFAECEALKSVDLSFVITIGKSAFRTCKSLVTVDLPNAENIDMGAFAVCESLTSISAPKLTRPPYGILGACTSLTDVSMPNLLFSGESAFSSCTSLKRIYLPNATEISNTSFIDCTSLTEVNAPRTISIGLSAFQDCTSLTNIDFQYVEAIYDRAFYRTALESINLPKVWFIGELAFSGCGALRSVNFPSATIIRADAFYRCTSLDTLILSNTETVCNLNLTAVLDTKIAGADGMPTGEGFIYVPEVFYEQYMANLAEQAYMLLVYSGYSEAEAEYMAPYLISMILRTIEGGAQATTFGLRNPLANFKGFTEEAIERFKANYKSEVK